MKKIFTYIVLVSILFSCTSEENETNVESIKQTTFNNLKAYNNVISFYYYSPKDELKGKTRIYLDTINNIFSQYSRVENKGEVLEEFNISESSIYYNYIDSNIDYIKYTVNNLKNEDKPIFIILSHKINTDKFLFNRIYSNNDKIFLDNFQNSEYFKNQNP